MRKLILALVMVVMCWGVTGCGELYQNKNYLPVIGEESDTPPVAESYSEAIGEAPKKSSPLAKSIMENINPIYNDNYISALISFSYDQYGKPKGLNININNKSKEDIKVIWNDTYFINNMNPDGGFMFDGIRYVDRELPKQDALIFPSGTLNKNIYPNSMIVYIPYDRYAKSLGIPTGWLHKPLTNGVYGAYVHIVGKDYDKKIKLTLSTQ